MPAADGAGQVGGGVLSPFLERQRVIHAARFIKPDTILLDVGCGRARLLDFIPSPRRYTGVDILSEVIRENLIRFPQHEFRCLNIEREELPAGRLYSAIVMLALLEHLGNAQGVIRRLAQCLDVGGRIILTTPHPLARRPHEIGARMGIFSRDAAEEHTNFLDRTALLEVAEQAGLALTEYYRFQFGFNQVAVLGRRSPESVTR